MGNQGQGRIAWSRQRCHPCALLQLDEGLRANRAEAGLKQQGPASHSPAPTVDPGNSGNLGGARPEWGQSDEPPPRTMLPLRVRQAGPPAAQTEAKIPVASATAPAWRARAAEEAAQGQENR